MTDRTSTTPLTFDLRGAGGSFASIQRKTLFLYLGVDAMLAVSAAGLGFLTYGKVVAEGIASTDSEGLASVLGIACFALAFMALSTPRFLSGATDITVGDEGILLRYPRGRADSFPWTNSKRRFLLYDYSAHLRMVEQGRAYSLIVPWGRLSMLTQESFQSILEKARERGAQVTSYRGSAARYGFSPVIYRVQGRAL